MESDEGVQWEKWGECSKEKTMKSNSKMRNKYVRMSESLMRKLWNNTKRRKHNEKRTMKPMKYGKRIVQKGNKHLPPCTNMIPCVNHNYLR
jgi:hypothetical protein